MRYFSIIGLGLLLIQLSSCKKFLEETSPSIVIPKEPAHFRELLFGEGYPNFGSEGFQKFGELLTDNVAWEHLTNLNPILGAPKDYNTKNGWGVYLFTEDPESIAIHGTDDFWASTYKAINVCNMVISGLNKAVTSDGELQIKVKGEAFGLRALHYLSLMNIYAMPYVKGADSEYGVPVKLSSEAEDRLYHRSSVHTIYNMIKADLDSAVNLLEPGAAIKLYEFNWYAAVVLATRVNLYMENYNEVVRLGEMYLSRKSEMPVPTQVLTNGTFMGFTASWSGVSANPEVIFNYGSSPATYSTIYQGSTVADFFNASPSLKAVYSKSLKAGEADQRMTNPGGYTASWFFAVASSRYVPRKIYNFNTRRNTLRTAEILLNLAEAYANLNDLPRALGHLNALRASRIKGYSNHLAADYNQASLKEFIADERRREFCFEDHRLPDLKRYGMPSMTHVIEDYTGKYKVEIAEKDFGYIFQIPLKEREINQEIKRIPRPSRTIDAF